MFFAIDRLELSSWEKLAIAAELSVNNGVSLVCRYDCKVIGWICCRHSGSEAELLKIAVSGAYRKLGIAKCLLDRMVHILAGRGVTQLFLEVRSENHPAVNFYHKRDFTEVGRRTNYYREPQDDALVFEKRINGTKREKNEKCP